MGWVPVKGGHPAFEVHDAGVRAGGPSRNRRRDAGVGGDLGSRLAQQLGKDRHLPGGKRPLVLEDLGQVCLAEARRGGQDGARKASPREAFVEPVGVEE